MKEHYPGEADEAAADENSACENPCPYGSACFICEGYWTRMEYEGYWKDGQWTDKGIKEMYK